MMTIEPTDEITALSTIEVSDSKFLGFVRRVSNESEAISFQTSLRKKYPEAGHVAVGFIVTSNGNSDQEGFDEDDEPPNSTGPGIVKEIQELKQVGLAVVIVRLFGGKLLGVTCGRLTQCYRAASKRALHQFIENKPLEQEYLQVRDNIYGLAAGDTELILNVVEDPDGNLLDSVRDELEFGGFKGSAGEVLPRLQNLQASVSTGVIPVYRYPGNYHGDEWETFEWKPTSLKITKAVEEKLLPLVEQKMNHCVTNYYRNGDDFIDHHSDKDLDLNREGVIVSVSLGDERILELRRRADPRDITRVVLPHCSMLVLGPKTNSMFTHSILKKEGSNIPRISLTLRDVTTFMDLRSGRLFGQGVETKSVGDIRKANLIENSVFFLAFSSLSTAMSSKKNRVNVQNGLVIAGSCAIVCLAIRLFRKTSQKKRDEKAAREFFSKKSATGTKY